MQHVRTDSKCNAWDIKRATWVSWYICLQQVREIITKSLSTEDVTSSLAAAAAAAGGMSSVGSDHLREENRVLQTELNRVEDLLAASRAERDEIGIKYNALSERVSLLTQRPRPYPAQKLRRG